MKLTAKLSEALDSKIKLKEKPDSQDKEFILQKLADGDVNAKIQGDYVVVDKSATSDAKKVLRSIKRI